MAGNISVTGVKALNDSAPASKTDVQSNQTGGSADLIHYMGGGTLNLNGKVLSSGSTSASINLGSSAPAGGSQYAAAQKTIPPIDIPGTIQSKLGTATSYTAGTVATEKKYEGSLVVNGDLRLNGGSLYVTGNLTVNGSITGDGTVYVGNETTFKGDAAINGKERVALYSKGNVILRGFDGEAYLDALAATNPTAAGHWNNARSTLQSLRTAVSSGTWAGGDGTSVDMLGANLGSGVNGQNYLGKLRNEVNAQPAGPTRDFMLERLDTLQRMFAGNVDDLGRPDSVAIADFQATGNTDGLLDAVTDQYETALMPATQNCIQQINYDKIGSSNFQGLIYTNGAFYSANEVQVVGAVVVNSDGAQAPFTIDGNTVNPGDLFLTNGSDITFIEDFFKAGGGSMTPASGPPGVRVWMGG
jgi:hypothetical protein